MASEKFRLRNTCSGRIGSAARASTMQNAAAAATASTASPMICADPQAYWVPPQVASRTSAVAATASMAAPR